jgi:hypothetical protein
MPQYRGGGSSSRRGINLFVQRDYDALVVTFAIEEDPLPLLFSLLFSSPLLSSPLLSSPLLSIAESFLTGTEAGVTVYRQQSGNYSLLLSIPSISENLSHPDIAASIDNGCIKKSTIH